MFFSDFKSEIKADSLALLLSKKALLVYKPLCQKLKFVDGINEIVLPKATYF